MSTGCSRWRLQPDRLAEAIETWVALGPTAADRERVQEFLMDLVVDPLSRGVEDGDSGIFTGMAGPNIVVMYVPEPRTRVVSVALIAYAPVP